MIDLYDSCVLKEDYKPYYQGIYQLEDKVGRVVEISGKFIRVVWDGKNGQHTNWYPNDELEVFVPLSYEEML